MTMTIVTERSEQSRAIHATAYRYQRGGLSVIPVKRDGSKAPDGVRWKRYQTERATEQDIGQWFDREHAPGIAVVCGPISGGLEVLDFDEPGLFENEYAPTVNAVSPGLLDRLPLIETPSGGRHLAYRCPTIEGNQKLAERVGDGGQVRVRIETRGEGGYIVAPGSPPDCHLTGRAYHHISGPSIEQAPVISAEQRATLLQVAESFNAVPVDDGDSRGAGAIAGGERPGDEYNRSANWEEILVPHGWKFLYRRGAVAYWQRPGKDGPGISATTGMVSEVGNELFYPFSSNAHPFEPRKCYSKFTAWATLNHGGCFSTAARALVAQGYGKQVAGAAILAEGGGAIAALDLTDMGNAGRFVREHGEVVRYVTAGEGGGWFAYDGKRWACNSQLPVEQLAQQTILGIENEAQRVKGDDDREAIAKWAKRSRNGRALEYMLAHARSQLTLPHDRLDSDPWLLNCANGTLHLRNQRLSPHSAGDYISRVTGAQFDPSAVCPRFDGFLERIMPCQDQRAYLQRISGLALIGAVREHKLFILYGDGANGKSVWLNTLRAVLGDYAVMLPGGMLEKQRYREHPTWLMDLQGARFAMSIESDQDARLDERLVKSLTSAEPIRARRMRRDNTEFSPSHTLFLATNHRPTIRSGDGGIWRRIGLLPFEVQIPPDEQDPELPQKLLSESAGILAWMVRGLSQYLAIGLDEPSEVRAATETYRETSDHVDAFLRERCHLVEGGHWKRSAVNAEYRCWCQRVGIEPMSNQAFADELERKGIKARKRSGGIYSYCGLEMQHGAAEEVAA